MTASVSKLITAITAGLLLFYFAVPAGAWFQYGDCCWWDGEEWHNDDSLCSGCCTCRACYCSPNAREKCPPCHRCQKEDEVCSCENFCDPDDCETCVDRLCRVCGGDLDKACCEGECFNFHTHMCCGGNVCRQPCCDNWACKHCVDEVCEPCLRKAADYEELTECSKVVDDPDASPNPNGCSSPLGNNPAWYVCGEASSFLDACNAHDECYATCGSNQSSCDDTFGSALDAVCAELSGDCQSTCQYFADEYEAWVSTYGRPHWEDGQVDACACCDC